MSAFITSLAASPAQAQSGHPDASDRFVLCGDYCGLVDGNGKRVNDRVFEKLDDFTGPVAVYQRKGKYGAIDRFGHRIVKPEHDHLWSPADGLLVAEDKLPSGFGGGDGSAYILFDERGADLLHLKGDYDFGGWNGRLQYRARCSDKQSCPFIFVDGQGKEIVRFAYFSGQPDDPLAIASPDGKHYGFVDATLRFVIPPRYTFAEKFERNLAKVGTAAGPVLIDRRGRELTRPGRYKSLYLWNSSPLTEAFTADQPECPLFLRPNGKPIRLPKGFCADDAEYVEDIGYAFIHDVEGRRGIIDAWGHMLIHPTYPWLRAVSDRYLVFGDDAARPKNFGVIDLNGKQILPPGPLRIVDYSAGCCSGPRDLRGALIGETPEGKTGLLGLDGRWIVPARYQEARVLSPDLVAMRDSGDHYSFFTAAGKPLPLESSIEPTALSMRSGKSGPFFFWRGKVNPGSAVSYKGLADTTGHILIPSDYVKIDDAGDGLLALWVPGPERIGFADHTGRIIAEPQFTELVTSFRNGAAVVRDRQGQAILLGQDGRTIANFADVFPEIANSGGGFNQIDQALDICIDPDPTAEPEEKPSQQPLARTICGDPALRAQSRETEKAWRNAQTGDCLPDLFLALRPAYDRARAGCVDGACVGNAMLALRRRITDTARRCGVSATPTAAKRPISASVRAQLRKRLIDEGAGDDIDTPDGAGEVSIDFHSFALGRHQAVLAIGESSAHNGPIWLFLRNSRDGWDEIFQGDAGYLRPLEATGAVRNGMPVLRTQQHVSCCEHAVEYYAYDGKSYEPMRSCTQLYDADETPVLFCEDKREDEEKTAQ